jgi:ATP synthase protein I
MSASEPPPEEDHLLQEIRIRQARHHRWILEGDGSVARRLAQIGVLGWMIVTPLLIGMFAGRWLDRTFSTGIFWTAPLLLVGLVFGCWSAWRWINHT